LKTLPPSCSVSPLSHGARCRRLDAQSKAKSAGIVAVSAISHAHTHSVDMASDDADFAAAIALSLADSSSPCSNAANVKLPEGSNPHVLSLQTSPVNSNALVAPVHVVEAIPGQDNRDNHTRAPVSAPPQHFAIKHICWGNSFCPILLQVSSHWFTFRILTFYVNHLICFVPQNLNGPCPLLAIANVLLLRNCIQIPESASRISTDSLLALVADFIVSSNRRAFQIVFSPSFSSKHQQLVCAISRCCR
jgi:hypothetical protein